MFSPPDALLSRSAPHRGVLFRKLPSSVEAAVVYCREFVVSLAMDAQVSVGEFL